MKIADEESMHLSSCLFADERDALDNDGLNRYVLMACLATRLNAADFVQSFLAIGYFAEHGITPSLDIFSSVIEEIIILHIDKKLCGG